MDDRRTGVPIDVDVVVVGAGLAGLSAAGVIHRSGHSVTVLEASDDVGGRVRTDRLGGFLLDRGFQVMLTGYPEFQLGFDAAALDMRTFAPGAMVWDGDRLSTVSDPFRRPGAAVSTRRSRAGARGTLPCTTGAPPRPARAFPRRPVLLPRRRPPDPGR